MTSSASDEKRCGEEGTKESEGICPQSVPEDIRHNLGTRELGPLAMVTVQSGQLAFVLLETTQVGQGSKVLHTGASCVVGVK